MAKSRRTSPKQAASAAPSAEVAAAIGGAPLLGLTAALDRVDGLALGAAVFATLPAVVTAVGWRVSAWLGVAGIMLFAAAAVVFDRRRWAVDQGRQMLMTLAFAGGAGGLGLFGVYAAVVLALPAAVFAFKRGYGTASALALGICVAVPLLRLHPAIMHVLLAGTLWPVLGATLMRRIASVQSGRSPHA